MSYKYFQICDKSFKNSNIYLKTLTKINNKQFNNYKKIHVIQKVFQNKIKSLQSNTPLKCPNKTQSIKFSVIKPNQSKVNIEF